MIKNNTHMDDFKNLCNFINVDVNSNYYFDQDLVDFNLIDVNTDDVIVNKVHKLCEMINNDNTILDKDLETEIWSLL